MRSRSLAAVLALAAPFARAQDRGAADAFTKLPAAAQNAMLAELQQALRDRHDPLTTGLLDCVGNGGAAFTERSKRLAPRRPKGRAPAGEKADVVMPLCVRYVFGVGTIEPVEPHDKNVDASGPHERDVAMRQMLRGMVPRADLALAVLLRRLDNDTTADAFAAFLHAWRNGDESFYEALDRTAGTKDAVFFYDAMLHEYASLFVPKDHDDAAKVMRSLQSKHDALHEAFLQYRRYRSFREAIAYALVLPPDVPLPARLRRFEEPTAKGTYTVRAQALMLRELFGGDPLQVADAIVAAAVPLPDPLWKPIADPIVAWNHAFAGHVPKMVELAGDTDALLERATKHATDAAAAVTAAAQKALAAAPR